MCLSLKKIFILIAAAAMSVAVSAQECKSKVFTRLAFEYLTDGVDTMSLPMLWRDYYYVPQDDSLLERPDVLSAIATEKSVDNSMSDTLLVFHNGQLRTLRLECLTVNAASEIFARCERGVMKDISRLYGMFEGNELPHWLSFDGCHLTLELRDGRVESDFNTLCDLLSFDAYMDISPEQLSSFSGLWNLALVGIDRKQHRQPKQPKQPYVICNSGPRLFHLNLLDLSKEDFALLMRIGNVWELSREGNVFAKAKFMATLPKWVRVDEQGYYVTIASQRFPISLLDLPHIDKRDTKPVFWITSKELKLLRNIDDCVGYADNPSAAEAFVCRDGDLFTLDFSKLTEEDIAFLQSKGVYKGATLDEYYESYNSRRRMRFSW